MEIKKVLVYLLIAVIIIVGGFYVYQYSQQKKAKSTSKTLEQVIKNDLTAPISNGKVTVPTDVLKNLTAPKK